MAGGGLMLLTGRAGLDPVIRFVVLGIITANLWGLLRGSLRLGPQAVPDGIDPAAVRAYLRAQPGPESVPDLHIWSLSSAGHDAALMAHFVRPGGLGTGFRIRHSTVQVEDGALPGGCPSHCEAIPALA